MATSANWFENPKRLKEIIESGAAIKALGIVLDHWKPIVKVAAIAWGVVIGTLFTVIFVCIAAVKLALAIPF